MAEKSVMWTTGATGDGATAYTQAEAIRMWRQMMISDTADEGVHKNYANELEVTGTATPVAVNTGAAIVYGFPYWNTASVDVAIATPAVSTRVDYITLEADWTAQTVRITRVAGTEGAGTPALTQTDGVEWQIPLATASITTGGVITVTDARVFLHPNIEIESGMIADSIADDSTIEVSSGQLQVKDAGVTAAKIANRTRTFWVQPEYVYNSGGSAELLPSTQQGYLMPDAVTSFAWTHFIVPSDFVSGMSVEAVMVPDGSSGNLAYYHAAWSGADGEATDTHTDASADPATEALTNAVFNECASLSLASAAIGDIVQLYFSRRGDDASDTISDDIYFVGWKVSYTADS